MLVFDIVGQNFGVLIAWVVISVITLMLFQWFVRRKEVAAEKEKSRAQADHQSA